MWHRTIILCCDVDSFQLTWDQGSAWAFVTIAWAPFLHLTLAVFRDERDADRVHDAD
jgi:hypothetical protein